ncbi:MAG: nucleotidyltransferase domain-containing protein [Acidobacteriota bacterium]
MVTPETLPARLHEELAPRRDLAAAWLFGSHAQGTARASSDVDVAVLFREPLERSYDGLCVVLDLAAELSTRLRAEVQVVDFDTVPADLAHRILRDGVLLLEHDRSRRVAATVKRRNEYFDLQPMLRRIRRYDGVEP